MTEQARPGDTQRVVVLGCGKVGAAVAERLRRAGHHVTGTTTRPERLDEVAASCDAAVVARGGDRASIRAATAGADAVVICVTPPERRSTTVADRLAGYREALVATAASVVEVVDAPHVLAISSLSVHGTGQGHAVLDESTPLPDLADPSPRAYREMEERHLAGRPGNVTILRTGDIVSDGDPSVADKAAMVHRHLGGSVPFDDRALAYRVTADEVARVVEAALAAGPQGVVHVVGATVPPTNAELYGGACAAAGLPPFEFRRELATPIVPVLSAGLVGLGVDLAGVSTG